MSGSITNAQMDEAARVRYETQQADIARHEASRAEAVKRATRIEAERAKVESYTPTKVDDWHFAFLVEAKPCVYCARPTIATLPDGPFPREWRSNFSAQRDRAGIQPLAFWHENNFPVCIGCKAAGKETFECMCCKQSRPLNELHKSFGMPAEHLCTVCHETVPAKKWEGLVAELEEQHRYDFE